MHAPASSIAQFGRAHGANRAALLALRRVCAHRSRAQSQRPKKHSTGVQLIQDGQARAVEVRSVVVGPAHAWFVLVEHGVEYGEHAHATPHLFTISPTREPLTRVFTDATAGADRLVFEAEDWLAITRLKRRVRLGAALASTLPVSEGAAGARPQAPSRTIKWSLDVGQVKLGICTDKDSADPQICVFRHPFPAFMAAVKLTGMDLPDLGRTIAKLDIASGARGSRRLFAECAEELFPSSPVAALIHAKPFLGCVMRGDLAPHEFERALKFLGTAAGWAVLNIAPARRQP